MKLFTKTFGCQMNFADSDEMGLAFARRGFQKTDDAETNRNRNTKKNQDQERQHANGANHLDRHHYSLSVADEVSPSKSERRTISAETAMPKIIGIHNM